MKGRVRYRREKSGFDSSKSDWRVTLGFCDIFNGSTKMALGVKDMPCGTLSKCFFQKRRKNFELPPRLLLATTRCVILASSKIWKISHSNHSPV